MSVVSMQAILDHAFKERYGVAAFNVFNDLSLEAVLSAAVEVQAPVIIQTFVKTVKSIGLDLLYAMWIELTRDISVPVSLLIAWPLKWGRKWRKPRAFASRRSSSMTTFL